MNKTIFLALAALTLAGAGYWLWTDKDAPGAAPPQDGAMVQIALPASLSEAAQIGKRAFEAKCATCHGANAVGQAGIAPPLVHIIYEPSHHGDGAFLRAVTQGVRAHHWRFGDMPPVEGLTGADVAMIVAYVRELQRENGIQ